jgi:hypothetical protein
LAGCGKRLWVDGNAYRCCALRGSLTARNAHSDSKANGDRDFLRQKVSQGEMRTFYEYLLPMVTPLLWIQKLFTSPRYLPAFCAARRSLVSSPRSPSPPSPSHPSQLTHNSSILMVDKLYCAACVQTTYPLSYLSSCFELRSCIATKH